MPHPAIKSQSWPRWFAAAGDPAIDTALRGFFAQLDADIAARKPTCWLSGKCCKFDAYGHKLYATGLEIAWALHQLDDAARDRLHTAVLPGADGCPFQVNKLCTVHAIRPLGCRVFFCDANAQQWQTDLYESFLVKLRGLHDRFGVEYRYMEWRAALFEARTAWEARNGETL